MVRCLFSLWPKGCRCGLLLVSLTCPAVRAAGGESATCDAKSASFLSGVREITVLFAPLPASLPASAVQPRAKRCYALKMSPSVRTSQVERRPRPCGLGVCETVVWLTALTVLVLVHANQALALSWSTSLKRALSCVVDGVPSPCSTPLRRSAVIFCAGQADRVCSWTV